MAKKYSKAKKSEPKKKKKEKKIQKRKSTLLKKKLPEKQEQKSHHNFTIKTGLKFEDILSKVIPLKGGKYGIICENGEFEIFSINNKKEFKTELSFNIPGANLFCQLGNGIFIFNRFNYITFWELKGKKFELLNEYESIFRVVIYSMEPIKENICAISGPSGIIELVKYTKAKKLPVIYLDYTKSKTKNKNKKAKNLLWIYQMMVLDVFITKKSIIDY